MISKTKSISSNRSAFSQFQFNVDLYHNSISIVAETTPTTPPSPTSRSQSNVILKGIMK